jgi:hypothetical protein
VTFLLVVSSLVVVLAGSTATAAVSTRLDSLRVKVFRQCDVPDAGNQKVTVAMGNDAVNLAITWVCANGPAIERFDTVWVTSSVIGSALNTDFSRIATAEMIWTDTTSLGIFRAIRLPLYPLHEDSLSAILPSKPDVQPTEPKDPKTWKYYRTFGGRFLLYPQWYRDDSMQVIVQYYAMDTLLQANASQTSVRAKFLDAVIEYAAYKISRKRNNFDDAVAALNAARMYFGMPPVRKEELLEK